MKIKFGRQGSVLLLATIFSFTTGYSQESRLPNIILIVADDLGYGDISYESRPGIVTPRLCRLAEEGMRFTDFHSNGPVCSPTRAALMTGRYQQRSGIESAVKKDSEGLPASEITIPEYLKNKGYVTAAYGKWHLGDGPDAHPLSNGFNEFCGHLYGSIDYRSHIGRWGMPDWWIDHNIQNEEGYSSDLIVNHAIDFINQHKNRPFFLYLPFTNIHFPWSTPEDSRYWHEGVDNSPLDRKLGPHSPGSDVTLVVQRMIQELDRSVGRIVDAVRNEDLEENTLIFFTSDNGGYIHYEGRHEGQISNNGPLRGQKAELYEGGIRVPAIAWWPEKIEGGSQCDQLMLTMDLLPTFLELTGIPAPPEVSQRALDGVSLASVFLEKTSLPERTVYWRKSTMKAVREGPWKLVIDVTSSSGPELYHLEEDIGESNDLSKEYPEITARLTGLLEKWEEDVDQ